MNISENSPLAHHDRCRSTTAADDVMRSSSLFHSWWNDPEERLSRLRCYQAIRRGIRTAALDRPSVAGAWRTVGAWRTWLETANADELEYVELMLLVADKRLGRVLLVGLPREYWRWRIGKPLEPSARQCIARWLGELALLAENEPGLHLSQVLDRLGRLDDEGREARAAMRSGASALADAEAAAEQARDSTAVEQTHGKDVSPEQEAPEEPVSGMLGAAPAPTASPSPSTGEVHATPGDSAASRAAEPVVLAEASPEQGAGAPVGQQADSQINIGPGSSLPSATWGTARSWTTPEGFLGDLHKTLERVDEDARRRPGGRPRRTQEAIAEDLGVEKETFLDALKLTGWTWQEIRDGAFPQQSRRRFRDAP